jgi:hypothetical protein
MEVQPPCLSAVSELLKKLKQSEGGSEKVEILDHEKVSKRGPVYVLTTLLNWVLLEEGDNPLWITFKHRKSVKKLVALFLTNCNGRMVNDAVKAGLLDSLKPFYATKTHIDMEYKMGENQVGES